MIGPVLYQEMLLGARRNRAHFFRWFYAGWILLQLCGMLFVHTTMGMARYQRFDYTAFAEFSRSFLETLVTQHYLVLLLAIPVLTAGAITDEKSRGTLQYLLVTELFSWEILVGKLIGRLYQVFLIALTPLPVMCFLGVFGGLDLWMLLALAVASLALAFGLGSMSLLASVLCRHTRDAVLGLYAVLALFWFGGAILPKLLASAGPQSIWLTWLESLLTCLDPLHPMGTGWSLDDLPERHRRLAAAVAAWGLVGLVCLVLATLRLRGSYLRYLEQVSKHRWWSAVAIFFCGWTALGLVALAPYLVLTGQLVPYLKGTSGRPWLGFLLWFLLGWTALGLVELLRGIVQLWSMGWSKGFLEKLHGVRTRNWWTRRSAIGNDPLSWKERHVEGVAPLAALRAMPRWLGMTLVVVATVVSSVGILAEHLEWPHTLGTAVEMGLAGDVDGLVRLRSRMSKSDSEFYYQGFVVMLLAGLVIAIRCSGAVTGEREKSTWEALLLTPLETRQLIRGKLWGIIGASMPYLAAYAVPALGLALVGGATPVFWTAVWLGVTLLAMGFVGAAGLWCSVQSKTSWRSLLGTLGITYVGGFILFCVTSPIMVIVAIILAIFLAIIENQLGINNNRSFTAFFEGFSLAMCITLAGAFALMGWRLLLSAEYRVGVLERTKHWRNEPKHPRWSRYARQRRWRDAEE